MQRKTFVIKKHLIILESNSTHPNYRPEERQTSGSSQLIPTSQITFFSLNGLLKLLFLWTNKMGLKTRKRNTLPEKM